MGRYVLLPLLLIPGFLSGQVSYERLARAAEEPRNWLTYSGSYLSQRYSALDRITPRNVKTLEQKWVFQAESLQKFEATPLVIDGVMYLTQPPNDVVAIDARTGRVFWIYQYKPAPDAKPCCGAVNRGLAVLGDRLFMATIDARLIAIDARSGRPLWNTKVADSESGYTMTLAPLVVKDKVIVGVAGGEYRDPRVRGCVRPRRRARRPGGSTRFPGRASRATRPGPTTIRGVTAARRCG